MNGVTDLLLCCMQSLLPCTPVIGVAERAHVAFAGAFQTLGERRQPAPTQSSFERTFAIKI